MVKIHQLLLGDMANFSYVIIDTPSQQAAIVDPHDEIKEMISLLKENHLTLTYILLTHGHFDHIGGAYELSSMFQTPVCLSSYESPLYQVKAPYITKTQPNQILTLGNTDIICLHTPGHTPGCQSFLIEKNLFTGDTLFIDAVGRTDFPGGDEKTLLKSLAFIKTLPDDTIIWPGHDYGNVSSNTLKNLKMTNPYLP